VFRCIGCVADACKGPSGCANPDLAWRREQGGYLRQILTAKVYQVAKETPLQYCESLSEALGNQVWLKREDLQVRAFVFFVWALIIVGRTVQTLHIFNKNNKTTN
jgi:hypothetical protein